MYEPLASDEMVKLAVPPVSGFVPNTIAPDLNVTDPVGVPEVDDVTVAVNVTACPAVDGFCDDVNAVVVDAFVTTWDRAGDVLAALFASPLYTAVIMCVPTASVEEVRVAVKRNESVRG